MWGAVKYGLRKENLYTFFIEVAFISSFEQLPFESSWMNNNSFSKNSLLRTYEQNYMEIMVIINRCVGDFGLYQTYNISAVIKREEMGMVSRERCLKMLHSLTCNEDSVILNKKSYIYEYILLHYKF